jgi:DNA-binding winged helix-turn-helix (wHTH) protein/tetratricopeptide (TPR) repeat protein
MTYKFGDYKLDSRTFELSKEGIVLNVEPRVFALLRLLIEKQDRVVSKDELISQLWDGKPLSDSVISSCIKSARRAIGDDGVKQHLIKTVYGFGFRFVGKAVSLEEVSVSSNSLENLKEQDISSAKLIDTKPTILVLPFTSNSDVAHLPVLPEGLTYDIILGLSRLHWLKVIARASAFQLNDTETTQDVLHTKTGAKYCLSGVIEVIGKNLFLTIKLSNLIDNSIIWVERVEGAIDELHQLRNDIVKKAMATLEVKISTREAQIAQLCSPDSLDAWSAYHLGFAHLNRLTERDNTIAIGLFEKAIKLEPGFSRAHAGLSFCHFWVVFNGYKGFDLKKSVAISRASAERSVELDSLDPFANFVMGRTHWLLEDPEASLPWIERSLAINPNYAQAHYIHGLAGVMSGQAFNSQEDASMAMTLSPLDPFLFAFYGVKAIASIGEGDYVSARKWANSGARQPGAIFMAGLVAAVANLLAGFDQEAEYWLKQVKNGRPNINIHSIFRAFPFTPGITRERIHASLIKLGLS